MIRSIHTFISHCHILSLLDLSDVPTPAFSHIFTLPSSASICVNVLLVFVVPLQFFIAWSLTSVYLMNGRKYEEVLRLATINLLSILRDNWVRKVHTLLQCLSSLECLHFTAKNDKISQEISIDNPTKVIKLPRNQNNLYKYFDSSCMQAIYCSMPMLLLFSQSRLHLMLVLYRLEQLNGLCLCVCVKQSHAISSMCYAHKPYGHWKSDIVLLVHRDGLVRFVCGSLKNALESMEDNQDAFCVVEIQPEKCMIQ